MHRENLPSKFVDGESILKHFFAIFLYFCHQMLLNSSYSNFGGNSGTAMQCNRKNSTMAIAAADTYLCKVIIFKPISLNVTCFLVQVMFFLLSVSGIWNRNIFIVRLSK